MLMDSSPRHPPCRCLRTVTRPFLVISRIINRDISRIINGDISRTIKQTLGYILILGHTAHSLHRMLRHIAQVLDGILGKTKLVAHLHSPRTIWRHMAQSSIGSWVTLQDSLE